MVVTAVVATQLVDVSCFWAVLAIGAALTELVIPVWNVVELRQKWVVEVHNEGRHHAHLWCASKDDRIGDDSGVWVAPGEKLAWSFRRHMTTQFWCTMDWYGQRVGWDVYVTNWKDAPNPTKWSIRDDGVFDQWRNRKWRHLNS